MAAVILLALGADCSKAQTGARNPTTVGQGAYVAAFEEDRAIFLGIPSAVPDIARQVATEFPKHPPQSRQAALLVAAARVGFAGPRFDKAIAETDRPTLEGPDAPTIDALQRLSHAYAMARPARPLTMATDEASRVARMLPSIAMAHELGLALDRINLLCEATRDPGVVRAMTPSVLASDGSDVMAYSRGGVGRQDEIWGGNQRREIASATGRNTAALRSLTSQDIAAIGRWYDSAGGRAEVTWRAKVFARANDVAGAVMTRDYYRRMQTGDDERASNSRLN